MAAAHSISPRAAAAAEADDACRSTGDGRDGGVVSGIVVYAISVSSADRRLNQGWPVRRACASRGVDDEVDGVYMAACLSAGRDSPH